MLKIMENSCEVYEILQKFKNGKEPWVWNQWGINWDQFKILSVFCDLVAE